MLSAPFLSVTDSIHIDFSVTFVAGLDPAERGPEKLPLPLLVPQVRTHHSHDTITANDFAVAANLLD